MHRLFRRLVAPGGRPLVGILLCGLWLVGCSGGSDDSSSAQSAPTAGNSLVPTVSIDTPQSLVALQDDPQLLSDLPVLHDTRTLADTGIQLGLAGVVTTDDVDADYIERQWVHMQSCLDVNAVAPLIIVSDQPDPLTPRDDVLRDITGMAIASSSLGDTGIVIQIHVDDFSGSLGNVGFNLRSILGRTLWLSAGLPERDYPVDCARTMVP